MDVLMRMFWLWVLPILLNALAIKLTKCNLYEDKNGNKKVTLPLWVYILWVMCTLCPVLGYCIFVTWIILLFIVGSEGDVYLRHWLNKRI